MGAWEQKKVSDQNALVDRVVNVYGIDRTSDPELANIALTLLDETVKEMNAHLYEFNRLVESNIALTTDQPEYTLTNGVYRESLAYLVNADGTNESPMMYLPYVHFVDQWLNNRHLATGIPIVYSFRNVEQDGKVSLAPSPNGGAVIDYALTVEYYRRIPLVSSQTTSLDIPPEVEPALVYGSQKRLAIHLYGPGHPDVGGFEALESRAIEKMKAVDKRHPDTNKRFRLTDNRFAGKRTPHRGTLFIRIR